MSETMNVGLTDQQREILLRGLRFVRSAVALEFREPSPEVDNDRAVQYRTIGELVAQLEGARPAPSTSRVS
jgi:hypothetical protein